MAHLRALDHDDLNLRKAGFDPATPPAQALATLDRLRGHATVTAAAIARALGNVKSTEAADRLIAMEREASGTVRREVRRSLFRLGQSGISPSPGIEPSPPRPAAAVTVSGMEGLLSPIDPAGVRLVWLIKSRPRGGLALLWGFASEEEGLVGVGFGPVSRHELRADRKRVEERAGVKFIEADWRLCDLILCEAYRETPASRRLPVGSFFNHRAEIIAEPPPDENFVHPIYSELPTAAHGEPSIELLKEPEVLGWKFTAAMIKPYVDEIAQIQQSVIVLSPIQQQDRITPVIDKAIEDLFSGDRARRTRRRLEDIAYYLEHSGRRSSAIHAAAAARKIREGADLKSIPFFQNFVRTILGASIAEQQEHEREEPRLIMTPAEAMRSRQQRQPHGRQG
ncbi:MAG: hypothetical protein IVW54_14245 [Candidatus Binataceae bacterium]|nr:hypothetical protein [Candidatus Binataceae bacterium]